MGIELRNCEGGKSESKRPNQPLRLARHIPFKQIDGGAAVEREDGDAALALIDV